MALAPSPPASSAAFLVASRRALFADPRISRADTQYARIRGHLAGARSGACKVLWTGRHRNTRDCTDLEHGAEKACPGLDPGWTLVFPKRPRSNERLSARQACARRTTCRAPDD